jgi:pimeloyl-ACP methyl ester carboxylesterase
MNTQPTIVLVHGAWADGSSWSAVIEHLQADGYHVTVPQFPMTALAEDVARLRRVLARQNGPTIVTGHSYGGQIITALGTDAPNVVGLVYIAAFGLDQGESIGALLSQMGAASLAEVGPIVLLSLFFSSAAPDIGAHVLVLAFLVILATAVGFTMIRAARIAVLSADLRRLEDTTAQIRVPGAFMLVAAMGAVAIRLGAEGILGTFVAGAILRLSKEGAAMTTPEMRAKLEAVGFGVFIPVFAVQAGVVSR